jgi:uncharacterized membrane protein
MAFLMERARGSILMALVSLALGLTVKRMARYDCMPLHTGVMLVLTLCVCRVFSLLKTA